MTDTDTSTADTQGNGESGGRLAGASEVLDRARSRASDAYAAARERTSAAYGTARDSASRAGERASQTVETYPEAAIVGGLALGAALALILPRTEREKQMFGNVGRRITDTTREAVNAARDAAKSQLDEAGLSREGARQKLGEIASRAGEVARNSASAAAQTVKGGQ